MKRFDHRKYRPTPAPRLADRRWPDNPITGAPTWASVDLRDGNQALLEPMDVGKKRRLWALLVDIGFKEKEGQAYEDIVRDALQIKRVSYPKDVQGTAAFLASPDSDYMTGQMIHIDGGWCIQ